MTVIIDNISVYLNQTLRSVLNGADWADFCIGYFNLRGWRHISDAIDQLPDGGDRRPCRLLVGMQRSPIDELRTEQRFGQQDESLDNKRAAQLRDRMVSEFRQQLTIGAPTNADEAGLRQLAVQLRSGRLVVKLFLRYPLHAKLYLVHRPGDYASQVGYVGSSNLTMAGLATQGELNVDVVEQDAANKLARWFEDRWNDRYALDISEELARRIEESWVNPVTPFEVYVKMAFHLSEEARQGLAEFTIPGEINEKLFDFQRNAVKVACNVLQKRGGVLLGDVVGLGKTLMATAVAKVFDEDRQYDTLIICPKSLEPMWNAYKQEYRLRAEVMPISVVQNQLGSMKRKHLIIIDESHNLRNREGRRWRAIREYIERNDSKVMLLSATPYNKSYLDLSSQLRLFLGDDEELAARPEQLIREMGEAKFNATYQTSPRTLRAFEASEFPDDWRELMRLYMVRRTRGFVLEHSTQTDEHGRKYLPLHDGTRNYFPTRTPRTVQFALNEASQSDQFARLYADNVVITINALKLPRYGLGNYRHQNPVILPSIAETLLLDNLSKAGKRLMGFCRTNLFKRLESSGASFLQSIERHILRNYIVLHAIRSRIDIPIGTQDANLLDTRLDDSDEFNLGDEDELEAPGEETANPAYAGAAELVDEALGHHDHVRDEVWFQRHAEGIYRRYRTEGKKRFKWIRPDLFRSDLAGDLESDSAALLGLLRLAGKWNPATDAKLNALNSLLRGLGGRKALVFSQFADTVEYLGAELEARGIPKLAAATGDSANPTELAWRFSPESNGKRDQVLPIDELNTLIATDVLSEGQNLQDCAVVINYDMPWAIIRLIQRAGRVDRIGQKAPVIDCYSFLPAEGIERIIRLRARLAQRLRENAEVVGTDESFFEGDDAAARSIRGLYDGVPGILDGEDETEVDLASYSWQIWKGAIDADASLERRIQVMSNLVYSAKRLTDTISTRVPPSTGAITFVRTSQQNNALVWLNDTGHVVSTSQLAILEAARCSPSTAIQARSEHHHSLQASAVELVIQEETSGGQLGRTSSARYKAYMRLKRYLEDTKGRLFPTEEERTQIKLAQDEIYRFPLRPLAVDALNRQMRVGVNDEELTELILALRTDGRLCQIPEDDEDESPEPQIVCSLGVVS